jgi:O-antigen/teichoic acid export membrane protein
LVLSWLFIDRKIFDNILKVRELNFKTIVKEFIEYCHPLVIYSVVNLLVGIFDIWLLQKYGGSKQTGFYGLAYGLSAICFLFTSAMTPIITREFAKSYGERDIESMRRLFLRYIPMLYSISAYFAIFVVTQSENILAIFTDEKFKDAYLVLMVIAFYPIHQTYGQLSGSIFYATNQTKLMRNISLAVQPFGMLLTFLLIYKLNLGAIGLAWKMVIVQIIGVNIQLYYNTKFLKLNLKYFLWHQIYSVVPLLILATLSNLLIDINSPILEFTISGLLYTLWVIIFIYILPQAFATNRDEIKSILIRFKSVTKRETKK